MQSHGVHDPDRLEASRDDRERQSDVRSEIYLLRLKLGAFQPLTAVGRFLGLADLA